MIKKIIKFNHPLTIGISIGILHFIVVVFWDFIIKIAVQTHPESNMLWLLITFLDLPVVLIVKWLKIDALFRSPYIIFGLFGSLQYFFLGFLISYILGKLNKSKHLTNRSNGSGFTASP